MLCCCSDEVPDHVGFPLCMAERKVTHGLGLLYSLPKCVYEGFVKFSITFLKHLNTVLKHLNNVLVH